VRQSSSIAILATATASPPPSTAPSRLEFLLSVEPTFLRIASIGLLCGLDRHLVRGSRVILL
jgi:hypothetical protein